VARNIGNSTANRLTLGSDVADLKMQENDHFWSFHFWAKLVSTAGDQAFLAKYPGTSNRGILMRVNAAQLGVFWIDPAAGGTGREALSGSLPSAGSWMSLGGSYHPNNNQMTTYLNGTAGTPASGGSGMTYAGAVWKIGVRQGLTNPLNGEIAEVTFWDNLNLTTAQFVALSKGVPPRKVQPTGIVARWPLYGISSPEVDESGLGNHMTVEGSPAPSPHAPMGRY